MSKRDQWLVVALLSAGLAVDYLTRINIYSVFPLLRKELIASDMMLGLVASSFPWTYGALSPVAGYLGDRLSRRVVVLCSLACWSVAAALCGAAQADWQLVGLRVLLAVGQVAYMPTAQAFVADVHGPETRAKASGLFQAGSYVGIFMAGLPAATVATQLGWRMMLVLSGALGLALAVVMWWLLPDPQQAKTETNPPITLREALGLLRIPSLLLIVAGFALAGIAFWVLFTYLALFIYERYRVSLETAAFQATFYMQVSAMLLMPGLGAISDSWARRDARNRFLACALVGLAGIPALLAVGLGNGSFVLIAGLIIFGFTMAGTDASWLPMLCTVIEPRQRATAYGLMNACATLAGAAAAMATALLMKQVGLGFIITSLAGLFLLLAAAVLLAGYVFSRNTDGISLSTARTVESS